jgi:dienelactone hydrolase
MKHHLRKSMNWRIFIIYFILAVSCVGVTPGVADIARSQGPPLTEYGPPSGRGPVVILMSGMSGPNAYRTYAAEVAQLGYYAVLLDSKNLIIAKVLDGEANLRRTIEQAKRQENALPGKVAVIGFSKGGAGALGLAAGMPDLVSAIIAYYPRTDHIKDMRSFVADFKVPVLVLAGEKDTWGDCCLIETMRAMEREAKEAGKPFELVVYPNAKHSFNLAFNYRAEDSADAWQRTIKMLDRYHPIR